PLSMGTLVGDTLQCLYHGLRYDKTGTCVRVPGQDTIPRAARVKSYPVVERYHWLWIWMGDPARADPDKITDFHWFDDPNWGAKGEYLHVRGNWQLVVDNLLDLTHLAFVHGTTIGNPALVEQAQVKVQRSGDNITVTRWIVDAPPPPTFVKAGGFTGNVDRWQIINFTPPAADRHGRAGRQARRRHRHVEPQCDHAGNGNHEPLFLGAGAQLRHRQSEDDRHADRADQDRLPRGCRGVRSAAAQSLADSQPAADRHQCGRRRDPGAPHSRSPLSGRAGGSRQNGGGGVALRLNRTPLLPRLTAARDRPPSPPVAPVRGRS
ncbi:MAG: Rieske 2Fe-2S domain-containing protein, partial [Alphaproteobacteria bacterium]